MKKRDIADVIDAICKAVPSLEPHLAKVRDSAAFTAPECMRDRWQEAQDILASTASTLTPDELRTAQRIWNGEAS